MVSFEEKFALIAEKMRKENLPFNRLNHCLTWNPCQRILEKSEKPI